MTNSNQGREFWFLAYQPHPIPTSAVQALPTPPASREVPLISPEDFDLLCDTVETSSAVAGQLLPRRVIAHIVRAVLHWLGFLKLSVSSGSRIGSPAAVSPATGPMSNPR